MYRILLFALLFSANVGIAQVKISGKIIDNHNNPLAGISVSIFNSYDGATSDSVGNYSFNTIEKGEQSLQATSAGYKPFEQKVNIESTSQTINISLKEQVTELKAVVISAGTFEASDQKKQQL